MNKTLKGRIREMIDQSLPIGCPVINEDVSKLSQELTTLFQEEMEEAKKEGAREMVEEIKTVLHPDLKALETQPIGKLEHDWFDMCEKLGLEVIFQNLSDDVMGERFRPVKAITETPLKAWQELGESQRQFHSPKPLLNNDTK